MNQSLQCLYHHTYYFRGTFEESGGSAEFRESVDSVDSNHFPQSFEDEMEEKVLVIDQEKHEI